MMFAANVTLRRLAYLLTHDADIYRLTTSVGLPTRSTFLNIQTVLHNMIN